MNLAEILNELKPISNIQELENFFQKYLGKKGQLNAEF